ncbi:MAG: PEP-CTERM sorting domain-containing protein [Thermoguttaceae bacterium]
MLVLKKRVSAGNQVGRGGACLLLVLLICSVGLADGTWDANKPFPVPDNDNSCWMASAANMMAADGWEDYNFIYNNILKNNPDWQTHGGNPDPGYEGGYQSEAVSYYLTQFPVDPDEIILAYSWSPCPNAFRSTTLTPREMIDILLDTPTATETPGDIYPEGPDDPVGIAFWWPSGDAHAITVWEDTAEGTLTITDSDDGDDEANPHNGPRTLHWDGASQNQIIYNDGIPGHPDSTVTVGYASFLLDVPEPTTSVLFGTAFISLLAYVWRRHTRKV